MRFWPQREPGQDIGLADKKATKFFLVGLFAISIGTGVVFAVLRFC
tara:strand:+ start:725 stop:862 length:138 start_codon:yes stop_codon:yes gene_type:complete